MRDAFGSVQICEMFNAGRHRDLLGHPDPAVVLSACVGLGRIGEASVIADRERTVLSSTASGTIAMANLDQIRARLSDAFQGYEDGLSKAREAGFERLLLYGRIWRELALARFGDHGSSMRLSNLSRAASAHGWDDLSALASAFFCAACAIVGKPIGEFDEEIDENRRPALATLALSASILSGESADGHRLERLLALVDGVDGAPELVAGALHRTASPEAEAWVKIHVDPILSAIAAEDATIFPDLPDEPRMSTMDCARCDGRCCYDGVYVTSPEEERIRAFMKEHPSYFTHVPETFLEEGEWGFLFHGKRTVRVPYVFNRSDFPKHFTHTKCCFALPSGECSLQKAATENDCHPWKVKPELCWEFPLIGLFNDNAMEKPHYFGEPDPGYYDENQPGYLSFMPCARTKADGAGWKRMYRTEFLHYFKIKGIKR
ncbi:MAG: hypothetical protein WC509_04895 [Candidatus Izemoplasmatales bacterium]